MQEERSYQRKHLRAPYKAPILYIGENFVLKAYSLNISQEGALMEQIPFLPEQKEVPLMFSLPQFPYFKNFSLSKLENFNEDLFEKKVIRVKCEIVRNIKIKSHVDEVFSSRIGVKFVEITPQDQKLIADYVNIFASNLIYLQVLIDSLSADSQNLAKVRALSKILKYNENLKIAELRKLVMHDYKSLQWL